MLTVTQIQAGGVKELRWENGHGLLPLIKRLFVQLIPTFKTKFCLI